MKKLTVSLCFIVSFQVLQAASLEQLNNWFKRIKRGTRCLVKREPCDPEDTKAIYQAIGGIIPVLGLTATGIGLYTQREKIRALFAKSDGTSEEIEEQQSAERKKTLEREEQRHQSKLQGQSILNAIISKNVILTKQLLQSKPQLDPNDWTIIFRRAFYSLSGDDQKDILHMLYQDQRPELKWAKYNLWESISSHIEMLENQESVSPDLLEGIQIIESYLGPNPQRPPFFADI